ncbi:sensor histidine kinase [Gilliamella sp. B2776]|uniref:ATP-binding protein n=1 Tax=unclassified Gilliamella TaxID=2685620 RepID=UPI00226AA013|nr:MULTISPECIES: sensor histidine kinase [unclassified Gilliamella]MCX8649249.1 sensor histidine kinase [Gilliamella sp. B2779]MCX8655137.1 sensor histidine kinase [Gilliamella sp. B2737]MCX8655909.1 sensor histidine kinase [Gilliamella sp. B2894]MCX8664013.1 sensor histidine kinase [Gilliamella sp. B2887]MCX8691256.1 sensor histidine kinase [Gilliamella sp. B2776]
MRKKVQLSFATKLFLSLLLFSLIMLALLQSYIWNATKTTLYKSLGEKAQIQAKELSVIPSLIKYVKEKDTVELANLVNDIFEQSDASYIVIGDEQAYRLYHTSNNKLYSPMVGGDNKEVLRGKSSVTISEGSLGLALRGKAPIMDQGKIIGIISVGYMIDDIYVLHINQFIPIIIFCSLLFFALFVFSFFFSKAVKKQMFNLEPKEIALLVKSQKSIMESIFEGIIAIDLNYKIININQSARNMLDIIASDQDLLNHDLRNVIKSTDFLYGNENQTKDVHDYICYFNNIIVIANRIRVIVDDQIQGWVITFRNYDDINLLSMKLTQVTQYIDNLRALRHEHLNWMATLSGLIYMKRYEEAQSFITLHSADNQNCLDFISEHFKIPAVCGLLIGKYSKSHEIGLNLIFDPACQLSALPVLITETEFMSVLGNLLDNAFNACLKNNQGDKTIYLYLSDATDEIVLEVSDQGCGIDASIRESIFEPGVTSQDAKEHGIGLHLVSTYIKKANGYITFEDNTPYGTIFSVFIPK